MSRESDELGEQQHMEGLLGRGKGDPDAHGYPSQEELAEDFLDLPNSNATGLLEESPPF